MISKICFLITVLLTTLDIAEVRLISRASAQRHLQFNNGNSWIGNQVEHVPVQNKKRFRYQSPDHPITDAFRMRSKADEKSHSRESYVSASQAGRRLAALVAKLNSRYAKDKAPGNRLTGKREPVSERKTSGDHFATNTDTVGGGLRWKQHALRNSGGRRIPIKRRRTLDQEQDGINNLTAAKDIEASEIGQERPGDHPPLSPKNSGEEQVKDSQSLEDALKSNHIDLVALSRILKLSDRLFNETEAELRSGVSGPLKTPSEVVSTDGDDGHLESSQNSDGSEDVGEAEEAGTASSEGSPAVDILKSGQADMVHPVIEPATVGDLKNSNYLVQASVPPHGNNSEYKIIKNEEGEANYPRSENVVKHLPVDGIDNRILSAVKFPRQAIEKDTNIERKDKDTAADITLNGNTNENLVDLQRLRRIQAQPLTLSNGKVPQRSEEVSERSVILTLAESKENPTQQPIAGHTALVGNVPLSSSIPSYTPFKANALTKVVTQPSLINAQKLPVQEQVTARQQSTLAEQPAKTSAVEIKTLQKHPATSTSLKPLSNMSPIISLNNIPTVNLGTTEQHISNLWTSEAPIETQSVITLTSIIPQPTDQEESSVDSSDGNIMPTVSANNDSPFINSQFTVSSEPIETTPAIQITSSEVSEETSLGANVQSQNPTSTSYDENAYKSVAPIQTDEALSSSTANYYTIGFPSEEIPVFNNNSTAPLREDVRGSVHEREINNDIGPELTSKSGILYTSNYKPQSNPYGTKYVDSRKDAESQKVEDQTNQLALNPNQTSNRTLDVRDNQVELKEVNENVQRNISQKSYSNGAPSNGSSNKLDNGYLSEAESLGSGGQTYFTANEITPDMIKINIEIPMKVLKRIQTDHERNGTASNLNNEILVGTPAPPAKPQGGHAAYNELISRRIKDLSGKINARILLKDEDPGLFSESLVDLVADSSNKSPLAKQAKNKFGVHTKKRQVDYPKEGSPYEILSRMIKNLDSNSQKTRQERQLDSDLISAISTDLNSILRNLKNLIEVEALRNNSQRNNQSSATLGNGSQSQPRVLDENLMTEIVNYITGYLRTVLSGRNLTANQEPLNTTSLQSNTLDSGATFPPNEESVIEANADVISDKLKTILNGLRNLSHLQNTFSSVSEVIDAAMAVASGNVSEATKKAPAEVKLDVMVDYGTNGTETLTSDNIDHAKLKMVISKLAHLANEVVQDEHGHLDKNKVMQAYSKVLPRILKKLVEDKPWYFIKVNVTNT